MRPWPRSYRLHQVDITGLTKAALEDLPLNAKEKDRCKNFFALGLVSWIYTRPARSDPRRHQEALRQEPDLRRGQHPRAQGRARLRRDRGDLRGELRHRPRRDGAGRLPEHDRQPGARVGPARRRRAHQDSHRLRRVSDHARLEHSRGAGDAQALPGPDLPGRGRDRGGDVRHRRRPSAAPSG